MISEDLLQQAAAEFSDAMVASVEDRPHDFSPGFERRMQPLLRRAAYPVRYRFLRQCAAVLLALLIGLGALLALSPSARAIVSSWFREETGWYREDFDDHVVYRPPETTSPVEQYPVVQYDYYLPKALDGYALYTVIQDNNGRHFVYRNKSGRQLVFGYIINDPDVACALALFTKNYEYRTGTVGKYAADIFVAPDPSKNSTIVWEDTENNVLLILDADTTVENLIAMAETVQKNIKISE